MWKIIKFNLWLLAMMATGMAVGAAVMITVAIFTPQGPALGVLSVLSATAFLPNIFGWRTSLVTFLTSQFPDWPNNISAVTFPYWYLPVCILVTILIGGLAFAIYRVFHPEEIEESARPEFVRYQRPRK